MTRIRRYIAYIKKAPSLIVILAGLLMSNLVLGQQNTQFTQYIVNELIINPAYAGAEQALSISLLNRSQWSGVDGAPTTQALTAHSLIKEQKIGLGLVMMNDKIGVHNSFNTAASFSYRIELNNKAYLSFGLQAGIIQNKSDYNSLAGQVQNTNDPKLNSGNLSETNFEFGSGVYFITPRLNLGISMPNMLYKTAPSDSISYSLFNNNLYFLVRYRIPVSTNIMLQPGLIVRYANGLPIYTDINLSAIINKVLLVGVSYRIKESVNPILQAKITPQFKIGYSFDYPLANENSFGSNSHEFMISYLFSFSKNKVAELR